MHLDQCLPLKVIHWWPCQSSILVGLLALGLPFSRLCFPIVSTSNASWSARSSHMSKLASLLSIRSSESSTLELQRVASTRMRSSLIVAIALPSPHFACSLRRIVARYPCPHPQNVHAGGRNQTEENLTQNKSKQSGRRPAATPGRYTRCTCESLPACPRVPPSASPVSRPPRANARGVGGESTSAHVEAQDSGWDRSTPQTDPY